MSKDNLPMQDKWTPETFKEAYSQPGFNISEKIMAVMNGLDGLVEFRPNQLASATSRVLNRVLHIEQLTKELYYMVSDLYTEPEKPDSDAKSADAPKDVLSAAPPEEGDRPLCRERRL